MTARQLGGGKESHAKHRRKRSGVTVQVGSFETTLALGYTYLDVLDEENDGTLISLWSNLITLEILARLTFNLFPNPSSSLTPLLHETFTPALLSQTVCVILLDWDTPWRWLRDLRDWITLVMGFLHETTRSSTRAAEYESVVNEIITQCSIQGT